MSFWDDIKHFKQAEFDSPDKPGSGAGMDGRFVRLLDKLRAETGIPMRINSGFRTAAKNSGLTEAVKDSAHLRGLAADIGLIDDGHKQKFIAAAVKAGVRRIGIGNTFVHIDIDGKLPQNVVWPYNGTTEARMAWKPGILAAMKAGGAVSFPADPSKGKNGSGVIFGLIGFLAASAAIFWWVKNN